MNAICPGFAFLISWPPLSPQIRDIEAEVGAGQVEELIEQAKDELRLIPDYAGESSVRCHAAGLHPLIHYCDRNQSGRSGRPRPLSPWWTSSTMSWMLMSLLELALITISGRAVEGGPAYLQLTLFVEWCLLCSISAHPIVPLPLVALISHTAAATLAAIALCHCNTTCLSPVQTAGASECATRYEEADVDHGAALQAVLMVLDSGADCGRPYLDR